MNRGLARRLVAYGRQLRHLNRHQLVNLLRSKLGEKRPLLSHRPKKLSVYVTPRCNLKCHMCGYHAEACDSSYYPPSYPDMTFERFRHIMSMFPEASAVTLTAEGEPFLVREIYKMIGYAKHDLGLGVDSSTNGVRMDFDRLLGCGLDFLNISIDGTTAQQFNRFRGGVERTYDKIISNVRELTARRDRTGSSLRIGASFMMTMENYADAPAMLSLAADLGVDSVEFQNTMDFNTDFASAHRPIFTSDRKAVLFLRKLRKPEGIEAMTLPMIFVPDLERTGLPRLCNYPFNLAGVNSAGGVNPCCYMNTDDRFGNLFTEPDYWNNATFQVIRSSFLKGELPFELCRTCPTLGTSPTEIDLSSRS